MRTALCMEVMIEAGTVESVEVLQHKQRAQKLRESFSEAVEAERAAMRRYDELGPRQECPHCISTPDGEATFLCGKHDIALSALKRAMARRIAKQRALGEAEYALDRARKGLR